MTLQQLSGISSGRKEAVQVVTLRSTNEQGIAEEETCGENFLIFQYYSKLIKSWSQNNVSASEDL